MKIGAGARAYKTGSMDIPSRTIYLEKMMRPSKSLFKYIVCVKNKCESKNNCIQNMCLRNIYVILTPDLSIVITTTKQKGSNCTTI